MITLLITVYVVGFIAYLSLGAYNTHGFRTRATVWVHRRRKWELSAVRIPSYPIILVFSFLWPIIAPIQLWKNR
jgi:hypothetical protein